MRRKYGTDPKRYTFNEGDKVRFINPSECGYSDGIVSRSKFRSGKEKVTVLIDSVKGFHTSANVFDLELIS
tara:strand:+ start:1109 stop:1321 length:213 start_codon:yes stop_codon:yes gene_type:complete